jgi:hypothetical protein
MQLLKEAQQLHSFELNHCKITTLDVPQPAPSIAAAATT